MNYTTEQLSQIEKVKEVFKNFISSSPDIDLVWSEKIGYVYYNALVSTEESFLFEPVVIKDASILCYQLLFEIAIDVLQTIHNLHDLHECGPLERSLIEKACTPYMCQLPEYHYLIDKLFITPIHKASL